MGERLAATPHQRLANFLGRNRSQFPHDQDFAGRAGCSPARLSQILKGSRPSPALALKFQELAGIPLKAWFVDAPPCARGRR